MEEIEVIIKAELFKTTTYSDPWNCALATTLKNMGYAHNGVADDVVINDIVYSVPDDKILEVYHDWWDSQIEPNDLYITLIPM